MKRQACRYGLECTRKNPDHFQAFAHPAQHPHAVPVAGDKRKREEDEDDATLPMAKIAKLDDMPTATAVAEAVAKEAEEAEEAEEEPGTRRPCRYGAGCYRKAKDHRSLFSHPGDADYLSESEDDILSDDEDAELAAIKDPDFVDTGPPRKKPRRRKKAKAPSTSPSTSKPAAKAKNEEEKEEGEEEEEVEEKAKAEVKPPVASTTSGDKGDKEVCPFGATCFRTNADHRRQFWHPSSSGTKATNEDEIGTKPRPGSSSAPAPIVSPYAAAEKATEDKEEDEESEEESANDTEAENTASSKDGALAPLTTLAQGEEIKVKSKSSSAEYRVKRVGNHYYCTCIAWRQQKLAVDRRTCKHLKELLGDSYELARVGAKGFDSRQARNDNKPKKKPGVILAHKWDGSVDVTGWWISEKLDGVRAYWDGKQLLSRTGNVFPAPNWFTKDFPTDLHLDGELWCGRAKFNETVSIVRTEESPEWSSVVYHIFDAPKVAAGFEGRIKSAKKKLTAAKCEYIRVTNQAKCKGSDHVNDLLEKIVQEGGEGLMLRKPASPYVDGRSSSLLKVKRVHDADGRVIGYVDGRGKHKGLVGSLEMEMACGKKFRVGSGLTDALRKNPPPIGSIVTYRYLEHTPDGVPRFPTFAAVRIDATEPSD